MRQKISDKNILPNFSLEAEYRKLHDLFFDRSEFGRLVGPIVQSKASPSLSYNDCLQGWFLDWDLRGTFTSLEEMLLALQIGEDDFDRGITEERLLDYIQFILNGIFFVRLKVKRGEYRIYQAGHTIFDAIFNNSQEILTKLGAELRECNDEIFVIYKDDIATAVTLQEPELEPSIVDYLKIDNRGDVQRKGEILCTLSKKLEPHEKRLKSTEFSALCSDTTMLLDKIGARHALEPKDPVEAKIISMDKTDVEKWYDRTFQMLLACMAVLPYLDIKSKIKELKSST